MKFRGSEKVKVRFLVCFATWFALITLYIHRSNISVAILEMVEKSKKEQTSVCVNKNLTTQINKELNPGQNKAKKPFDWDSNIQGFALGSFFYGYASMHFLGGVISAKIGPRITLAVCLAGSTFFTFLMPVLSHVSPYALIFARVMSGVFSGPLYPVVHEVVGVWSAPEERTTLAVITHTGNMFGLMLNFGIGGFISQSGPKGWEWFFYTSGFFGVVSLILWILLAFDNPFTHPYISKSEVEYITKVDLSSDEIPESLGHHVSLKEVPFKEIFLSIPVLVCDLGQFASNFVLYSLLTGHAKFLSDVYQVSTTTASLLSMIPFAVGFVTQIGFPPIVDLILKKTTIDKTLLRKINSAFGFFGSAIFLGLSGLFPCGVMFMPIIFICISMFFFGINTTGYFTSIIDMSPKYAGVIMGIANTFGSVAGFTNPLLASHFTNEGELKKGWMYAFIVTGVITIITGVPYLIFGSSKLQPWAEGKIKTKLGADKEASANTEIKNNATDGSISSKQS